MNCLNKEEIQKYIDREVSAEEAAEFNDHISWCHSCRELYHTSLKELNVLMELLSKIEISGPEIAIPEFRSIKVRSYRLLRYFSVAASVLIIFGLTWQYQNRAEKRQAEIRANMEIEQLLYHSDANKVWNRRAPIVTITNKEGEIIYSTFED